MSDIFKIMQTKMFRNNNIIIFVNTIPIVSGSLYSLYNITPNPVLVENNMLMLIKPRIKFIALTIDQDYYGNSDQNEFSMCYDTTHFNTLTAIKRQADVKNKLLNIHLLFRFFFFFHVTL